jgi:hypothetical protein
MKAPIRVRSRAVALVTAIVAWAMLASALPASALVAPDATPFGPLPYTNSEYHLPSALDPEVVTDLEVELWAQVYRPSDLVAPPYPVVVFLHGNHGTCGTGADPRRDDRVDYTYSGTCPPGYVVTPNHLGYAYLAERLASRGYIVVSINANRGITGRNGCPPPGTDNGCNLARGRLVLRHLQRLSEWNTSGGTPPSLGVDLMGKLDFTNLGLMGHSRGGEGMRAAYNQYRDAGSPWPARIPNPVTFRAIFEIGPVDGQTSRVLNADGTVWDVLLPMCDGDVSNLQGVKPYDRMLLMADSPATNKSTYTVWGANHNFYNTEWQISDSGGCTDHAPLFPPTIGSPSQRQTSLASILAFFRGNVGATADPTFNQNFNPQYQLPPVVTDVTRVERGYIDSPDSTVTMVFERFDQPTGTSTYGIPNTTGGLLTYDHGGVPEHDATQTSGAISWSSSGAGTFFQTNWTDLGLGMDITTFKTLDFRAERQMSPLNPPASPTDFSVALVFGDETLSQAVRVSPITDLRGPVGGPYANYHVMLQTVRIQLAAFAGDQTNVRGVRFTFDQTTTGAIYLANVVLSTRSGSPDGAPVSVRNPSNQAQPAGGPRVYTDGNTVDSLRSVASSAALGNQPGIEIQVSSSVPFPVRDELVVLRIGTRTFPAGRYKGGDTHTLIFTLTPEEFGQTASGDDVVVQYGRKDSNALWRFGQLDKNRLNQ